MPALNALVDVDHWFGGDLGVSAAADLAPSTGVTRSQQRVLRRLMTNPGAYLTHPTYGAGLARFIGSIEDDATIIGVIKGQLALEASVAATPAPVITLLRFAGGISVSISYTALPDQEPVALSFDVTP